MKLRLICAVAIVCLCASFSFAQNSGAVAVWSTPAFTNASGNAPLANGFACFYSAGTTTPLAPFQDRTLSTPHHNPIQLNAAGRPITWMGSTELSIYFDAATYKIVLYGPGSANNCNGTPVGALIKTIDHQYDLAALYRYSFATRVDDNVRHCAQFTGANAGAKIAACIADLPSTGGTADARGLEGTQTIAQDVLSSVTKPVTLLLGAGAYTLSTGITLHNGQSIIGVGPAERWRSGVYPTKINYTGSTAAIKIQPGAGIIADSITIANIQVDGSGASGSVDGLLLDGSAGSGGGIEGILVTDSTFSNFPRNQIRAIDTVFDITFRHVTAHNSGRSASHAVHYQYVNTLLGAASQWTFDDCWLANYTTGTWAFFAGRTAGLPNNVISDLRFTNGTIAPYDATNTVNNGANGVWAHGTITMVGTHIENVPYDQPQSIGIRNTGSGGSFLAPSGVSFFGTGIELGNSGNEIGGAARLADESMNVLIPPGVGFNNNHCTVAGGYVLNCADVRVVQTGVRRGTYIKANSNVTTNNTYFGTLDGQPRVLIEPAFAITTCTNATPIACTTSGNHGKVTGDAVVISDVAVNTAANAPWRITVTGATTFTLDGSAGSGAPTANTGVVSTVSNEVEFTNWSASSGGIQQTGPLRINNASRRVGVNTTPIVGFHVRLANSDCMRLDDSSNSNRITAQLCNASNNGQLQLLDSGETVRIQADAGTNGASILLAPYAFANLPASNNGTILTCSDCNVANPCTGGGGGALAVRIAGAWVCK